MRMKLSYMTPLLGAAAVTTAIIAAPIAAAASVGRVPFSSPAAQAVRDRFVNRPATPRSMTRRRQSAFIPTAATPFCSADTATTAASTAAVDTGSGQ